MVSFEEFFVFWIALGVATFCFYTFNKNINLKRKLHPIIMISTSLIFGTFVFYNFGGPASGFLVFFMAILALITYLNIRNINFCDNCGRTIYNQMWFSKMEYCPKCGHRLGEKSNDNVV